MKITVETNVAAPIETVWEDYTSPKGIKQWNAASDDWHTAAAAVDLREGGTFSSRMEAKDGGMGFDFSSTYTKIIERRLMEYSFGGRTVQVVFTPEPLGVGVQVTFDSETTHSTEQQRAGWQAIQLHTPRREQEKVWRDPQSHKQHVEDVAAYRDLADAMFQTMKRQIAAKIVKDRK